MFEEPRWLPALPVDGGTQSLVVSSAHGGHCKQEKSIRIESGKCDSQ